ncbi:MAG: hypothetical protein DRP41_07030, partial [Thermodesulfobacteriota bacterium]
LGGEKQPPSYLTGFFSLAQLCNNFKKPTNVITDRFLSKLLLFEELTFLYFRKAFKNSGESPVN